MATKAIPSTYASKSLISSLKNQETSLQNRIGSSSSYSSNATPSAYDVSQQVALKKLQTKRQAAEDVLLKTQWYGNAPPDATPPKDSYLKTGLKVLSIPNYALVGALENVTGKGSKQGLANIAANVDEEEAFGSLLSKLGAPYAVSMPVGLGLDIATDPVNWATAGTAALVPRVGVALYKGSAKGALKGAASSVLARGAVKTAELAAAAAKKTPYLKTLKPVETAVTKIGTMGTKVAKAGEEYNKIIGKDVLAKLAEKSAKYESGKLFGQQVRTALTESPKVKAWENLMPKDAEVAAEKLQAVKEWRNAKPGLWLGSKGEAAKAKALWLSKKPADAEEVINWKKSEVFGGQKPLSKSVVDIFWPGDKDWMKASLANDLQRAEEIATGKRITPQQLNAGGLSPMENIRQNSVKLATLGETGFKKNVANQIIDDGALAATDAADKLKILNGDEVGDALAGEAQNDKLFKDGIAATAKDVDSYYGRVDKSNATAEELVAGVKSIIKESRRETGVGWFDMMDKQFQKIRIGPATAKDGTEIKPIGEVIANSYDKYLMGLFKTGKIGGNIIGAMVRAVVGNHTMGMMAGLNGWELAYQNGVQKSMRFMNGWMTAEERIRFLEESFLKNPKWVETLSKDPRTFQRIFGIHPDFNENTSKTVNKIFKKAKDESVDLAGVTKKSMFEEIDKLKKGGLSVSVDKMKAPTPQSVVGNLVKQTPEEAAESTLYAGELMGGEFQRWISQLEKKKNQGDKVAAALHWYLTKPMDVYSSADGGFKLGYALKMSNIGVTEKEVSMLSRFYPNIGAGIERDAATGLYKIHPEQAMGAAQEIFMNYGNMPAAVKVLRSMPLLGAPFGSFMYGMAAKTVKTAVYNPAVFTKINYFLKEFQGEKSPLERQQLAGPYYSWYNKDGMIKLPFFQDNPVYLNVADMIPYYTMNIMQPSERQYDEAVPSAVATLLDKLPFFKTPEGQIMMDYFVLPTMLRESNPKGMFGQPLWKTDSNLLEKFGYAARTYAETPLPTLAGVAGVVGGKIAPGITEAVPSFRYRQLANAVQGKTSVGISTQEDPIAKTTRILSGVFGLPWYTMNLNYSTKK